MFASKPKHDLRPLGAALLGVAMVASAPADASERFPQYPGDGVHVYVVGTGLTACPDNGNPSTVWVANGLSPFVTDRSSDYLASVVGSESDGMAPGVILHGVKVAEDRNDFSETRVVNGLNWIHGNFQSPAIVLLTTPGVSLMTVGVKDALQNLILDGVHVVMSAGHDAGDLCNAPLVAPFWANVVGGLELSECRSPYSNFGCCVPLFAPDDVYGPQSASGAPLPYPCLEPPEMFNPSAQTAYVAGLIAWSLAEDPAKTPHSMWYDLLNSTELSSCSDNLRVARSPIWKHPVSATLPVLWETGSRPALPPNNTPATWRQLSPLAVAITEGATTNGPDDCFPPVINDVWYRYTAPADGRMTIIATGSESTTRATGAIYAGNGCPTSTPIACGELMDPPSLRTLFEWDVVNGETYTIRIGTQDGIGNHITLDPRLCAWPSNDSCENPISVGDTTLSFETACALTDGPDDCVAGADVWYLYAAPASGTVTLNVSGTPATRTAVYAGGSCPTTPPVVACTSGEVLTWEAPSAGDYLIRIGTVDGSEASGSLSVGFEAAPVCPSGSDGGGITRALTMNIYGAGTGTDWSWKMTSPHFEDTDVVQVDGMVGTELEIACRFAESIRNYFRNRVCAVPDESTIVCDGSDGGSSTEYDLQARVRTAQFGGPPILSITSGSDFELLVSNPADPSNPTCVMAPGDLNSCEFNPVAEVIPLPGLDCNGNGWDDVIDIFEGASEDENDNDVPDECECFADLDGSGLVGFADLTVLLNNWGPCGWPCPLDIDRDGSVGFADLTLLLSQWGPCS